MGIGLLQHNSIRNIIMEGFVSRGSSGVLILLFFLLSGVKSSKILFFNGFGEDSHYSVAASLAEELSARNHSVTFLIGSDSRHRAEHPLHSKLFNFIFVEINSVAIKKIAHKLTLAAFEGKNLLVEYNLMIELVREQARRCHFVFQPSILEKLKNSNFDLVIFDATWPCCVALSEYLGTERVAIVPTALMPLVLRKMGNPVNPATTAESNFGLPQKMSFYQRVQNVVMILVEKAATDDYVHAFFGHYLNPLGIKPYSDSLNDVNVFITAADPLLDKTVATMPGHVIAAGLTTVHAKPLSQELEEFMQSSGDDGVIVFSLGTYVSHLPDKIVKIFRKAFSQVPQKVIWQWKNDESPHDMPENVKTMAWIPQNDILGHKKTRLLIFQAGNNGVYEAIYHAVPLLVMPLLGDQVDVAQRVVERGIGLKIDITTVTSQSVTKNIKTILTNPKYRNNVKHLSEMFHDYPLPPRVKAAHWIEHVLRFGSEHLKSPDVDFNFFQLNLLDVSLFLTFVILIFIISLGFSIKKLASLISNVCREHKLKEIYTNMISFHCWNSSGNRKRYIIFSICIVFLIAFSYICNIFERVEVGPN
ncbi:UDP-glucuronosyltransferase 2A3 [Holothuria leucospilota]|uniref:UDP-glucuronosyltransferase 2A3 n=1 Tax=Holothuria leucospilota TaxID=206669 RepID=A0A9Q1C7D4_HOLLE|nr:UDP-glucuronosyltransferase 2A3 [Holothuria leucospilota]